MPDPHHDPDAPNPLVAAVGHHLHLDDPAPGDPGSSDLGGPPQQGGRPKDPGSGGLRFLAWLVLIVAVGYTVWIQWLGPPPPVAVQPEMTPPGGLMKLAGRYAVGSFDLLEGMDPSFEGEKRDEMAAGLIDQLDGFAGTPEDRLRVMIVQGEISGPSFDPAMLADLELELTLMDEPPAYAEQLFADIATVRGLLSDPPLAPADPDAFRERHAWFGDLALAQGLEDESPARAPVLAKARRTTLTALTAVGGFVVVAILGFILGIVAIILVATGKITAAYRPPAPGGSVYLEIFALFILGFLGVSFASEALFNATGADYSRVLMWLLLLLPFWALIRGARAPDFRQAMGWHLGKGLFREIGSGIVGYVACLPIFLLGVGLTLLLVLLSGLISGTGEGGGGGAPTHPIIDRVNPNDLFSVLGVFAIAAVWAPLVEESMFRGAFYHHMRGRLHPILAALFVAFVFAAIHPQGWVAIPALMSLAVTFALLREWRGSLVAPVVAHAMHNGALMTGLVLALR